MWLHVTVNPAVILYIYNTLRCRQHIMTKSSWSCNWNQYYKMNAVLLLITTGTVHSVRIRSGYRKIFCVIMNKKGHNWPDHWITNWLRPVIWVRHLPQEAVHDITLWDLSAPGLPSSSVSPLWITKQWLWNNKIKACECEQQNKCIYIYKKATE